MSATLTKTDGVTVFTLTSDPQTPCPPLCQVLKGLCHSPVCCSVSEHLRRVQGNSQSVLGALHFMVGLLNIGLGTVLCSNGGTGWWGIDHTLFPFWFGGMFMLFGAICMLSDKCPSPCLVIVSVILNIVGVALVIAIIVLYFMTMAYIDVSWMCPVPKIPPPREDRTMEICLYGKEQVLGLMRGLTGVLIVLSVLELCLVIATFILGIKTLRSRERRENKSSDDAERCEPLVEEITT